MEDRFKAERVKFGVEGVVLTSATPPTSPTTTPSTVNADGKQPHRPRAAFDSAAPDATTTPGDARNRQHDGTRHSRDGQHGHLPPRRARYQRRARDSFIHDE